MKIQRQKKIRRRLDFFKNNFGFKAPFTMIVDGTFCFAALQHKVNISDQLPKLFEDSLKILTTPCIVTETEKIGPSVYGAFTIVKQFGHHPCGHATPVNGAKCVRSIVKKGNKDRFVVASQDKALRSQLRTMLGVPITYLHNSAPTLEKPPDVSTQLADRCEAERVGLSKQQRETITSMKRDILGEPEVKPKKKRKVAKGANPLSHRRRRDKQTEEEGDSGAAGGRGRRRRHRVKLAKHVKEELARREQSAA